MNQKELNEIRRRFKLDKNSISRIYGCYVNSLSLIHISEPTRPY